jgi:hypothetical protein
MSGNRRIFYNVFPKSGTHLVKLHRNVPEDNHVSLFLGLQDRWPDPCDYVEAIKQLKGDFTGHIPYSSEVHAYLVDNDIRHVFLFRHLWDVALSLAHYIEKVEPCERTEFNVRLDGIYLKEYTDIISACIKVISDWWSRFDPWLKYTDSIYSYRELRAAAFLLKDENTATFNKGRINAWAYEYKQHHIDLANQLLPDLMHNYFDGELIHAR